MNKNQKPAITIGMAHYEDFNGVYFTVQALKLYHSEVMKNAQIVIIDNSPASADSAMIKNLTEGRFKPGVHSVKNIPFTEKVGTSPSRNAIFENADADIVLVMDCHVLLVPDALKRLMDYYKRNPDTGDILSGPLVLDDLQNYVTHFNDMWRAEMWGIWGVAWECSCGKGVRFSMVQKGDENTGYAILLEMEGIPIKSCHHCKRKIPELPWAGHENRLRELGYKPLAEQTNSPEFEIPGQGLGLFTCRKDAWLGFNEHSSHFGGEELYIHEKFRQAGHKALCLPFLRWVHRFGRVGGVKYPIQRWSKVRNYVLEFQELGLDLKPVHDHFVKTGLLKEESWDALVEDPVKLTSEPGCGSCQQKGDEFKQQFHSLDQLFEYVQNTPRDLNEHVETLKEYASIVDRVTEISNRQESFVAFFTSKAKSFSSYNIENTYLVERTKELGEKRIFTHTPKKSVQIPEIDDTDFLFIDSDHTYSALTEELNKYAPNVKRFIAIHDTFIYREKGEDGGPGLQKAILDFMKQNPEWSVVYHTVNQYGLTILGCQDKDKPKLPSKIKMAENLTKAIIRHGLDKLQGISEEDYNKRLEVCTLCEQRNVNRCAACGCPVEKKASWGSERCPLGRWPNDH